MCSLWEKCESYTCCGPLERGDDGGGGRAEYCVDYLRRGPGKMRE